MKKIISILAVAAVASLMLVETASAQLRTSYFMNGSMQRYDMNAALTPDRGYIALPVVGDLNLSLETNFLSADNFFFPNGTGNGVVTYMHKSVLADDFLKRLPDMNHLELGLTDQILGIGNYFKGGFWSFGVRLRTETNIDIPKDFFALTKTLSQGTYDIAGMSLQSSNFVEASLGYAFPVLDVFTLGFRAKMLLGLAQVNAKLDKMNVEIGEESYRADLAGTFESNIAGFNFADFEGEVTMERFVGYLTDPLNFDPSNIKSVGFAFDAGIEWLLLDDNLRLSAAVNDLGYNAWNAQNSFCATVDNVAFSFEGYDFENNKVKFESPENIVMRTTADVAEGKSSLHTSIVVGCEYNLLNDLIGLGVMWNKKTYDTREWNSIGGAVTLRPTKWFTASASYSMINQMGVYGIAANYHSSLLNIFVGADYIATKFGTAGGGSIPIPLNQNSVNISFGVAIPLSTKTF